MNATARKILIIVSILVLASLACSFSADSLSKNGGTFTVSMDEDQINEMLNNSHNSVEDEDILLDEITGVEFSAGVVRVIGTYQKDDGSTATGSYDVRLNAEDGALQAEITGVDIEGVTLDDPKIQKANRELADDLARSARDSKGEVEFESVEVTDEAVTIQVKTHWDVEIH